MRLLVGMVDALYHFKHERSDPDHQVSRQHVHQTEAHVAFPLTHIQLTKSHFYMNSNFINGLT